MDINLVFINVWKIILINIVVLKRLQLNTNNIIIKQPLNYNHEKYGDKIFNRL